MSIELDSSCAEGFVYLPEGQHDSLAFLGTDYRKGDALFRADFEGPGGEIYTFAKTIGRGGRAIYCPAVAILWKALRAPWWDMTSGDTPEDIEWRPLIGRRVSAHVSRKTGPSGRPYAHVSFDPEIVRL